MKKLVCYILSIALCTITMTACADYSYEEQILTHDVQHELETQMAATFANIGVVKTLYDAAGKGEDEFNRVLERLPQLGKDFFNGSAVADGYSYDHSVGKYRDEFLSAYNHYKDLPMLGHKDSSSMKEVFLYQRGDVKFLQYNCDVEDEAELLFVIQFDDMVPQHRKPEEEEAFYFDYSGKTFSARVYDMGSAQMYNSDGMPSGMKFGYKVDIYDQDNMCVSGFGIRSLNPIEEKAFTRWLDQFYLSTFGEVVQNAKAFDVK